MDSIGSIGRAAAAPAVPTRSLFQPVSDSPRDGTAAVAGPAKTDPVRPPDTSGRMAGRPLATFLAHLIATREQIPQTRVLRRAAPEEAIAAYAAAVARATTSRVA